MYHELSFLFVDNENLFLQQLFFEVKALVEWKYNKNCPAALKYLYKAFHLTIIKMEIDKISYHVCSNIELRIANSIAIFEYLTGDTQKSILIFKRIIHDNETIGSDTKRGNKIIESMYFLGLTLTGKGNIDEAYFYINAGIDMSLKLSTYLYLFSLYYHLIILYHLKHKKIEFNKYLHICSVIACTQNKYPLFLAMLKKDSIAYALDPEIIEQYGESANYKNDEC